MVFSSRLRLLSLALLTSTFLTACEKPEEKEAKYLEKGNAYFAQADYAKARLEYKNAAQIMPADAEPRYRLGLVDEAQNDPRNAFAHYLAAEQQNARYVPALLKLANYFIAVGELDQADHRLAIVTAEQPENAEGYALRAAILLRRKDYEGAEKQARLALGKDSANITAIAALTGTYDATRQEAKADATIEEGLRQKPDATALLLLRVTLAEKYGQLDKIVPAYQALFKVRPQVEAFRADLARLYVKAGRLAEAEATLREGVAAMPESWAMKKELAVYLSDHQGVDAAEKEIRGWMQANPKRDELYFWLAELYLTHKASDRAEQLLSQIITREEGGIASLNARTSLARLQFLKGDRELTARLVAAVLEKDPANQEALLIRAQLAFDQARYEDIVSDLRLILRDNPKSAPALQLLAETLLMQRHLNLAIDTQTQLVELDSTNPAHAVRLAQLFAENGNEKRALEILDNTTRLAPSYAIAWESKARAAISTHNWEQAEAAIMKLDALEGQRLTVLYLKGQLLAAQGHKEEALPLYQQVFTAAPDSALAEHALASFVEVKQSQKALPEAVAVLQSVTPQTPFLATLLGGTLLNLGQLPQAAEAFDRAIAAQPSSQEAYIGRARIAMAQNKPDEALALLATARQKVPSDIRAPMIAASFLDTLGRHKEAVEMYDTVLSLAPGSDVAANNMAQIISDYLYTDAALLAKALKTAERFANSSSPAYLDTLGWIYFRVGNIQQAQVIMERVMASSGAERLPAATHYHYACVLLKQGKAEQAKEELRLATVEGADYPGIAEARRLLSEP